MEVFFLLIHHLYLFSYIFPSFTTNIKNVEEDIVAKRLVVPFAGVSILAKGEDPLEVDPEKKGWRRNWRGR